jgi:Tol biopolymer transport system component
MKRSSLFALLVLLAIPGQANGALVFERPSNGSVYVAHNDGTQAHLVARGSAPLVSPSGRYVAFERVVSSDGLRVDLFVKGLPNGKVRRVVRTYGGPPLAWSRDSKRFLAAGWTAGGTAAYVFNVRTGRRHVIDTSDEVAAAAFSPNGGTIVLEEVGRDSGELHAVPPRSFKERDSFDFGSAPVWGSAGLAYGVDNRGTDDPHPYSDIVVRRFLGSERQTVLHTQSDYVAVPVGWSADGATLLAAEVRTDDLGENPKATAVLVTPQTGETRTLQPVFSAVNGLSRDGRQVLAEQNGDVVTATDDGTVRRVAANATDPSWTR